MYMCMYIAADATASHASDDGCLLQFVRVHVCVCVFLSVCVCARVKRGVCPCVDQLRV